MQSLSLNTGTNTDQKKKAEYLIVSNEDIKLYTDSIEEQVRVIPLFKFRMWHLKKVGITFVVDHGLSIDQKCNLASKLERGRVLQEDPNAIVIALCNSKSDQDWWIERGVNTTHLSTNKTTSEDFINELVRTIEGVGMIEIDLLDIQLNLISAVKTSLFVGEGEGKHRARQSVQGAITLPAKIAKTALVSIKSGMDLRLEEFEEVMNSVSDKTPAECVTIGSIQFGDDINSSVLNVAVFISEGE